MKRLPPLWAKPRSSTLSTRRPRLIFARIGLSDGSNASSVMLNSVTRTGTMRVLLHTNSVSGGSMGTISSVPALARELLPVSCALVGYNSSSSAASCGWMPSSTASRCWLGDSSWSVASISASSLKVSIAGPFSRSASERSPPSPPTLWAWKLRDSVSGLYCSEITCCT